jgi:SpoVK/Ycf46/Vps4 family AAA+-type ATPase
VKRIYIPMPDAGARRALLQRLLAGQPAKLGSADLERIVAATEHYSSSDLAALCREAAIIPLRCAVSFLLPSPLPFHATSSFMAMCLTPPASLLLSPRVL